MSTQFYVAWCEIKDVSGRGVRRRNGSIFAIRRGPRGVVSRPARRVGAGARRRSAGIIYAGGPGGGERSERPGRPGKAAPGPAAAEPSTAQAPHAPPDEKKRTWLPGRPPRSRAGAPVWSEDMEAGRTGLLFLVDRPAVVILYSDTAGCPGGRFGWPGTGRFFTGVASRQGRMRAEAGAEVPKAGSGSETACNEGNFCFRKSWETGVWKAAERCWNDRPPASSEGRRAGQEGRPEAGAARATTEGGAGLAAVIGEAWLPAAKTEGLFYHGQARRAGAGARGLRKIWLSGSARRGRAQRA